jgi:hypothetical protein
MKSKYCLYISLMSIKGQTRLSEAVVLARMGVVDGVQGIGLPPWKVVANAVQLADSPVCVYFACAMTRQPGTYDPNVIAVMKNMPDYVKTVAESDRNLTF